VDFDRLRRSLDLDRLRRAIDPDRLRDSAAVERLRRRLDAERLRGADLERLRRGADRIRRGVDMERLRENAAFERSAVLERLRDTDPVTRRRLLQAVPGAAGALLLAGAASTTHQPRATASPRRAKPHQPENATGARRPRAALRRPVFTLSDYRRAVPGPAFPTDAVALTIDDGPHPVWTPKILALLERHEVPALFCMIGNQVLGHEKVARSVIRAGHQLANHTWSHPASLAHKSPASVRREIHKAQEKIHDTTGYAPRLFRSPGGTWSSTVMHESAQAGLLPLDWSDDPRDWTKPGTAAITHRLLAARPGQILLCHDGGGDRSQTYAALSAVIPALRARGYRFVAL
jgi:peptidoglycan/xylan/chitin deacetylase (PgdA/CDA1 family)